MQGAGHECGTQTATPIQLLKSTVTGEGANFRLTGAGIKGYVEPCASSQHGTNTLQLDKGIK